MKPILYSEDYKGPRWTYGMTHRPPAFAHQPDGRLVGGDRRDPRYPIFGVIVYPFPLSAEDVDRYELEYVDPDLTVDVLAYARRNIGHDVTIHTWEAPTVGVERPYWYAGILLENRAIISDRGPTRDDAIKALDGRVRALRPSDIIDRIAEWERSGDA